MSTTTNARVLVSDVCRPSVDGGSTTAVIGHGFEAMMTCHWCLSSLTPVGRPRPLWWFPRGRFWTNTDGKTVITDIEMGCSKACEAVRESERVNPSVFRRSCWPCFVL
jgi:hypothetical protein